MSNAAVSNGRIPGFWLARRYETENHSEDLAVVLVLQCTPEAATSFSQQAARTCSYTVTDHASWSAALFVGIDSGGIEDWRTIRFVKMVGRGPISIRPWSPNAQQVKYPIIYSQHHYLP